ncbi:hypothetical protein HY629_02320 [Candidatus Uhrbacteria bacterium]|nr:hypothetical protein [Candidatus Uhrbacteria bacterium]
MKGIAAKIIAGFITLGTAGLVSVTVTVTIGQNLPSRSALSLFDASAVLEVANNFAEVSYDLFDLSGHITDSYRGFKLAASEVFDLSDEIAVDFKVLTKIASSSRFHRDSSQMRERDIASARRPKADAAVYSFLDLKDFALNFFDKASKITYYSAEPKVAGESIDYNAKTTNDHANNTNRFVDSDDSSLVSDYSVTQIIREINNYTVKASLTEQEFTELLTNNYQLLTLLKGEKGDKGDKGEPGTPGPPGYSIGYVNSSPTDVPSFPAGTLGGITYFGAKEAVTEKLTVTNTFTQSSGTATFKDTTIDGTLTIDGHILPSVDNTYDLGSATYRFRSVYLGPGTFSLTCTAAECTTARMYELAIITASGATQGSFRIWDGSSTNFLTISSSGVVTIPGQIVGNKAPSTAHVFSAWPTGTSGVSDASLYINPASATADANLIGAAVAGTVKFLVDAEGDVYANNLILSGSTSSGATTIAGNLTVQDSTTFGDAATDTITFTGTILGASPLVFEGSTANDFETTLAITDPTADRIITVPNSTGTLVLTSSKLSDFAATTSAELAGVISDEQGSGALVFATSPTLVTPALGAATYITLSGGNITDSGLTSGRVTFASTGGLLVDDADLTFATDTLTVTKIAATTFTGNPTITKADPSIVFDVTTATDTDFWLGVQDDAGSDDDDKFQIGDGTTPGSNPFLTIDTSGNVGIGTTNPVVLLDVTGSATLGRTSGDFQYGRLGLTQGGPGGTGSTIFGGSGVSTGSGEFDSYTILELIHRSGMVDGNNQETNEVDWVVSSTVNTGGATKQKIAAIETYLSGTTANDRGGEWRLDTKQDGGVLANALTINNTQRIQIGQTGLAATPVLVNVAAPTTGLWWEADPTPVLAVSVNGGRRVVFRDTFNNMVNSLTIGSNTQQPRAALELFGSSGVVFNRNSGTKYNWQMGPSIVTDDTLQIIPSTAAGGFTFSTPAITILPSGNVGIGQTTPTAVLHLKAGTTAASTAPLKFTSGSLMTTAEAGAVEFLTDAYYGTITTGAARKTFAFLESPSFTTPTLGAATATSIAIGANTLDTNEWANLDGVNQTLATTSAVVFATLDTGQGANELYDMDQNVLTTSTPVFAGLTVNGAGTISVSSTTAFTINNGAGSDILIVDTTAPTTDAGIEITGGSAQSGDLLLIQNSGGTDLLNFGATGKLGIGDNVSIASANVPAGSVVVGNGALCVDNSGDNCDDSARTAGTIYANNATVSGLDVAEYYPVKDESIAAGELVEFSSEYDDICVAQGTGEDGSAICVRTETQLVPFVVRAVASQEEPDIIIGVVSTDPGFTLGGFGSERFSIYKRVPLALAGRVLVKVTEENGAIKAGDRLTLSKTVSGYAQKMTESGQSIGIALEGSDSSEDSILVFVNLGYQRISLSCNPDESQDLNDETLNQVQGCEKLTYKQDIDMAGFSLLGVKEIASISGNWSISEDGTITAKQLCLEEVCVTKEQLKSLLELLGNNNDNNDNNPSASLPTQGSEQVGAGSGSSGSGNEGEIAGESTKTPSNPDPESSSGLQESSQESEQESEEVSEPEPQTPTPEGSGQVEQPAFEPAGEAPTETSEQAPTTGVSGQGGSDGN